MLVSTTTTVTTCHDCGRPVGLLRRMRARPYVTEHLPDGTQRHHCRDRGSCKRAQFAATPPAPPQFTLITTTEHP